MKNLDQIEQDALKELFNLGMGRAADSLSKMLGGEILLSIPYLAVLPPEDAAKLIQQANVDSVSAIRQTFTGPFDGTAMLIFPESNSLELVRTLVGEDLPLEHLGELEQESLLEVGNIVLNACLGSFANLMQAEISFALPAFMKGQCLNLLTMDNPDNVHNPLVFLIIDFRTVEETPANQTIKGFVILLLDSAAAKNLKHELQQLLDSI